MLCCSGIGVLLAVLLLLANPHDLHRLAATILKEELPRDGLVSVLGSKVNHAHWNLGVESVTGSTGTKLNLYIHAVVDNDMESVLELLHFIRNTTHGDGLLLLGLDDTIALDDFPDAVAILCEGSVLSVNLANIGDLERLALV